MDTKIKQSLKTKRQWKRRKNGEAENSSGDGMKTAWKQKNGRKNRRNNLEKSWKNMVKKLKNLFSAQEHFTTVLNNSEIPASPSPRIPLSALNH